MLSGKVFEYVAARRPILAAVPPNGAAANLIRGIGAGRVVDGDDAAAISRELEALVDECGRWLPDIELSDDVRERLSRRSRARELAGCWTEWRGERRRAELVFLWACWTATWATVRLDTSLVSLT